MYKPTVISGLAVLFAVLLAVGAAGGSEPGAAAGAAPQDNPMVHAEGTRLVDGDGEPIKLRGVLLEGWLMWNGTLWGAGLTSETKMMDRIEGLVGEEEAARFREAFYDSFISERDIERIANLGLNVVRVPFNHTVLEKDGAIDPSAPGWAYLDRLLDWCEKHEVYVVLDLHSVPGGQSGVFVADPDLTHVWKSEADLQRTVDLWKAIATRYHARSIVAGYDLINEPEPPNFQDLVDLYRRIITAIRSVDPYHLVFLTGTTLSTDFSSYEGPIDDNQAYTFHTYDFFTHDVDESQVAELARIAEEHDVPLWNGEFGAHTDDWTAGADRALRGSRPPRQRVDLLAVEAGDRDRLAQRALPAPHGDRVHRSLGHGTQAPGIHLRPQEDPERAGDPGIGRVHRGLQGREADPQREDGRGPPELESNRPSTLALLPRFAPPVTSCPPARQ